MLLEFTSYSASLSPIQKKKLQNIISAAPQGSNSQVHRHILTQITIIKSKGHKLVPSAVQLINAREQNLKHKNAAHQGETESTRLN